MKKRKRQELLPATLAEHEAIEYARRRFAFFHDNPVEIFGMADVRLFGPDVGEDTRRRGIETLKCMALDAQRVEAIVDYGRAGWDLAQEALRQVIMEFKHRRQEMPPALAGYDYSKDAGSVRAPISGPKPYNRLFRNIGICILVAEVGQKFGLKPYRNRAGPRLTGCSVVAAAISAEDLAVEKIWQEFGRLIRPIYSIN
jgi:hypothetical protein